MAAPSFLLPKVLWNFLVARAYHDTIIFATLLDKQFIFGCITDGSATKVVGCTLPTDYFHSVIFFINSLANHINSISLDKNIQQRPVWKTDDTDSSLFQSLVDTLLIPEQAVDSKAFLIVSKIQQLLKLYECCILLTQTQWTKNFKACECLLII